MARDLMRREQGITPFGDRWDPFGMLRETLRWDPFRELERMMGREGTGEAMFVPSFDVKETKDGYELSADLPGLSEDDVDVTLTGNRLTVSGERTREKKDDAETYYAVERRYGAFQRTFTLPEDADVEHSDASFENGVLNIHVGKREGARSRRLFGRERRASQQGGVSEATEVPKKNGKKQEQRRA